MKRATARVKIVLIVCLAVVTGCTESTPTDINDIESRYDQFYWIMTPPAWPAGTVAGTYAQTAYGTGYMLDADSLYWEQRKSYPVTIKRNGEEIWFRTPGNAHTFRGTVASEQINGYMIAEGVNGRPGPITYMELKRVQR